jgi:beta-aspartyl-dipeptidase (metallo-type)
MALIRKASVFAPESIGTRDILATGERIVAIEDPREISISGIEVDEIDASGLFALPGLIDSHVHLLGGGGDEGPTSRAPEIRIEDIVGAGVTTVIGGRSRKPVRRSG